MDDKQLEPADRAEEGWDHGWDGHEKAQLQRMSEMSLYEKIGWLEEAHRLVRRLQANRIPDARREGAPQDEDECSPP